MKIPVPAVKYLILPMHLIRSSFLLICLGIIPCPGETLLQETWQTGYQGRMPRGAHVLGYWTFDAGGELKDQSRHQRDLILSGAAIHPEGLKWSRETESVVY